MDKLKVFFFAVMTTIPGIAAAYLAAYDTATGNTVRLNVTEASPKAYFRISGAAPAFKNKEKFMSGAYADADDSSFFRAVVTESMKKWNDVEDSFVELALEAAEGPGPNSDDKINNISIGAGSWSDAGSALAITGKTDADSQYIVDCDITLDSETEVEKFADTILHELGHCLGLKHPHYSTKSIMSYSNLGKKFELALDDKAGITVLYPVAFEKRKNLIPLCGNVVPHAQYIAESGLPATRLPALLLILIPLQMMIARGLKNRKQRQNSNRS